MTNTLSLATLFLTFLLLSCSANISNNDTTSSDLSEDNSSSSETNNIDNSSSDTEPDTDSSPENESSNKSSNTEKNSTPNPTSSSDEEEHSSSSNQSNISSDTDEDSSSSIKKTPAIEFNEIKVEQILAQDGKLPFLFDNKSRYSDDEIYIAIMANAAPDLGYENGVWVDIASGNANPMLYSDNTIEGPEGSTGDWNYANCWTKLSDIPENTISIPRITSGKMFIAFKKPLYLHFHENGGYAQPNHNNTTDPSRGIRFETIEVNTSGYDNGSNGIWVNTSRVDFYQYPMGLEIWGEDVSGVGNTYRKIGELLSHDEILTEWQATVPEAFQDCYIEHEYERDGIIMQPSKIASFQTGGTYADYFQPYIDEVWEAFRHKKLKSNWHDLGTWEGEVSGDVFTMRQLNGNGTGSINGIPTTIEVIEASGLIHEGSEHDKNVQKFFAASFNRGIIDPDAPDGQLQDWGDEPEFYKRPIFNEYAGFFHRPDISYDSDTYAFSYDDVYDLSSTIQATYPEKIRITIGGFANVLD